MFRKLATTASLAAILATPAQGQFANIHENNRFNARTAPSLVTPTPVRFSSLSRIEPVDMPATFTDMLDHACPAPDRDYSRRVNHNTVINSINHVVTRETAMPAVILELYHVGATPEFLSYAQSTCGKWDVLRAVTDGINAYKDNHDPSLDLVIISQGHGLTHQGNTGGRTGVPEYVFSWRSTQLLEQLLTREGYDVHVIEHDAHYTNGHRGPHRSARTAHLTSVAEEANRVAQGRNAIFIEPHTNYLGSSWEGRNIPLWAYISPRGSRQTRLLAESIATETTAKFCALYPADCASTTRSATSSAR